MKKLNQSSVVFTLGLLILIILCIYPLATLVAKIIIGPEGLSFKYFSKVLSSQTTITSVKNTFIISMATAVLSAVFSIPLAWLFTRTNLPRAKRWRSLFCLPYAIPPYIGAIAWIYLANPSSGLLNNLLGTKVFNIYSHFGLIWVMACSLYTFVLLSLLSALDRMDPSLEEAARLSGASPYRVFMDITFPLIRPSLISGFLLVALAAAASFGVPAMIGNPARIYLMTTRIYTFQKMGSLSGLYQSGALSTILMFLAIAGLFINQWILGRSKYQTVSGKSSRPSLLELKNHRAIKLVLSGLFFCIFILPLIGILVTAFNTKPGELSLSAMGLKNFNTLFFETSETPRAFFNSFILAITVAISCCVLGLILSYIQWKTKIKGRGLIEVFASLPYSTPGTVIALAFILAFSSNFLGLPIPLYNTMGIIAFAYIAKYLNFSIRTTGDGFQQIDDSLAEAARVCGASWLTTLKTIWFPLMKPSLMASFFLIFMPAFSELTMTILLTGPGLETVGTVLFQLQEYADASGGSSAVLALVIICFVAGCNFLVKKLSKGQYGL